MSVVSYSDWSIDMCSIKIWILRFTSDFWNCIYSILSRSSQWSQSSDPPSVEEGFLQTAVASDDFWFIMISAGSSLQITSTLCLYTYTGGGVAALLVLAGLICFCTNITIITFCSVCGSMADSSSPSTRQQAGQQPPRPELGHAQYRGPRVYHGTKRTAAAEI